MVWGDDGHSGAWGLHFSRIREMDFHRAGLKNEEKAKPKIAEYKHTRIPSVRTACRGKVTTHIFESQIFKGTRREYSVYVPAQYRRSRRRA